MTTRLLCPFLFVLAVVALVAVVVVEGADKLKVGIHGTICDSTAKAPPGGVTPSIQAQINAASNLMAVYVTDSDISTYDQIVSGGYSVLYMGAGGRNFDTFTDGMVAALAQFVSNGGGLVLSAMSHDHLAPAASLQPLFPVTMGNKDTTPIPYCRSASASSGFGSLSFNSSWLSTHLGKGMSASAWSQPASCWFSPSIYTSGSNKPITIASFAKDQSECCTYDPAEMASTCSQTPTATMLSQGAMIMTYGTGRVVWLCHDYCGYETYGTAHLRTGYNNQLFLNAISWSSGKCRLQNDCGLHGACGGKDTCVCDSYYSGTSCDVVTCTPSCVKGTCTLASSSTAPYCACQGHFTGADCSVCQPGWFGSNCDFQGDFQDPLFDLDFTASSSVWHAQSTLRTTPIDNNQVTFCGLSAAAGTESIQQTIYLSANSDSKHNTYVEFDLTVAVESTSRLQVIVDNTLVIATYDTTKQKTHVAVNLSPFADNNGHTIKFMANCDSSAPQDSFVIDNITKSLPVCSPDCKFGSCVWPGVCSCYAHWTDTTCFTAICGDGFLQTCPTTTGQCADGSSSREDCDDGNTIDGDGCSSICTVEAQSTCSPLLWGATSNCTGVCGNGRRTPDESCDDGNLRSGDGCSSECRVEAGFNCWGVPSTPSSCLPDCGDGVIVGNETCDDHGVVSGDGCSAVCQLESGWDCRGLPSVCQEEQCGNGVVTRSEECDGGTGVFGCYSNCTAVMGYYCSGEPSVCTEKCGNRYTTVSEECDDGNTVSSDGCSSSCTLEVGWSCFTTAPLTVCQEVCGNGYKTKGEQCDDGNTNATDGCTNLCRIMYKWHCSGAPLSHCEPDVCGNGVLETGSEQCDDSNTLPVIDGCSATCQITPGWVCNNTVMPSDCFELCGNSYVTDSEVCDDGNTKSGDGCASNCSGVEAGYKCTVDMNHKSVCSLLCGDGILSAPAEQCDDGNRYSSDGCSGLCQLEDGFSCSLIQGAKTVCHYNCGDGIVTAHEACDIGSTSPLNAAGCVDNCTTIKHGYTCNLLTKPSNCTPTCGDSLIAAPAESCDDGNTKSGDGCSDHCLREPAYQCLGEPSQCRPIACPNGYVTVTSGEECDDGNTNSSDGCVACKVSSGWDCSASNVQPSVCVFEVCGDGRITKSEACDDGNKRSGDGCSSSCLVERGWICQLVSPSTTKSTCVVPKRCGNGYKTPDEACDDGNLVAGDGCSALCGIESGWSCSTIMPWASVCHLMVCGDSYTEALEECDDGNLKDGDGCAKNCTVEPGFSCKGTVCSDSCGNGVLSVDSSKQEECDDGNRVSLDGCSSSCKVERGYTCSPVCASTCGDGLVASDETCDDKNTNDGDGCSSSCHIELKYGCSTDEPSVCMTKVCDLKWVSITSTNVLCGGQSSGEIHALANGTGVVYYQLLSSTRILPPWEQRGDYTNLPAGNYTIQIQLDASDQCALSTWLVITTPSALASAMNPTVTMPSLCDSADGALEWKVKGGTGPYTYSMGANRVNQTSGKFTGLTALDFDVIVAYDANMCSLSTPKSSVPDKQDCVYTGFDKFVRDVWNRGGTTGVVILGVCGAVVLISIFTFCVWDITTKPKPPTRGGSYAAPDTEPTWSEHPQAIELSNRAPSEI